MGYEWVRDPADYPHWIPPWIRRSLGDDYLGDVVAVNFDARDAETVRPWSDEEFDRVTEVLGELPELEVVGFGPMEATETQLLRLKRKLPRIRVLPGGFGPASGTSPF